MPKKRPPHYDADFKRRAAEQVLLHHRPVAQVARELRCSPQSVRNWIEQRRKTPSPPRPATPTQHTTFLPLQVDEALPFSPTSGPKIEIVTKSGLTLRFPVETPSDTLITVIHRLEAVPC